MFTFRHFRIIEIFKIIFIEKTGNYTKALEDSESFIEPLQYSVTFIGASGSFIETLQNIGSLMEVLEAFYKALKELGSL